MPAKQGNRMDSKPKIQLLKQKRSFLQYILLSVVTCSLYHYWFMDSLVKDVNAICKKDGQDTVGVGRMIGFSILTFGVYQYLWLAEIVDRVYDSADEYDVEIRQDSESFFIWMILVPFIGYFIAMHRFVSDVNQLAAEYEKRRHFVKCTSPITQRSLSSGRGTLIGLVGSLAGQTIELKPGQRIKIGRSAAEASVIVNSEKISRVHCLVQYNGNQLGYTVTDLSRNGVVVNGKRILYSVPTYVPDETFDFLGYTVGRFHGRDGRSYWGTRPSRKSVKRLIREIHDATTSQWNALDIQSRIDRLNPMIRGWAGYFSQGPVGRIYRLVDNYVARRLRIWLMRRRGKRGTGYRQYPDQFLYETLGLIRLLPASVDRLNAKV